MGLAKILNAISTTILLGTLFFVVFMPVGLVRRIVKKKDQPQDSYFIKRTAPPTSMKFPF